MGIFRRVRRTRTGPERGPGARRGPVTVLLATALAAVAVTGAAPASGPAPSGARGARGRSGCGCRGPSTSGWRVWWT